VGWWAARSTGDHAKVAAALWTPLGALAALAINQPIVNGVREARPYRVLSSMLLLAHRSSDYSFPSDHAVMAGAVASGLFLVNRRLGIVAALAALLMAFARVYVGVHYVSDVTGGVVLGLLCGATVWWVTSLLPSVWERTDEVLARRHLRPPALVTSENSHASRP